MIILKALTITSRRKYLHKMKENDKYDHGILWATWKDRFTPFHKTEIWIRPYDIEVRDRRSTQSVTD